MTVTLADRPTWPDGDPGKVLLNCIINTNVDETFEELFGSYPETQVCDNQVEASLCDHVGVLCLRQFTCVVQDRVLAHTASWQSLQN